MMVLDDASANPSVTQNTGGERETSRVAKEDTSVEYIYRDQVSGDAKIYIQPAEGVEYVNLLKFLYLESSSPRPIPLIPFYIPGFAHSASVSRAGTICESPINKRYTRARRVNLYWHRCVMRSAAEFEISIVIEMWLIFKRWRTLSSFVFFSSRLLIRMKSILTLQLISF